MLIRVEVAEDGSITPSVSVVSVMKLSWRTVGAVFGATAVENSHEFF